MPIVSLTAEPIFGRVKPDVAIISSLGQHVVGQYVLVRMTDDAGRVGLGEASITAIWSGETQAGTLALLNGELAALVVGADPFDVEWISRRLERAVFGNSFARAALESALLDLQGKTLGVPLYKLLGGKDTAAPAIRLKFVVGAVEPDVAAQRAKRMVDAGWKAIKVKVGRHEHPRTDVERLAGGAAGDWSRRLPVRGRQWRLHGRTGDLGCGTAGKVGRGSVRAADAALRPCGHGRSTPPQRHPDHGR